MAKQATDYVNYVFTKDNPGWSILYAWFTDALLQKNGIVKVWWDEYEDTTRESYNGLNDDEMNYLVEPEEVEVVEHTEYSDGSSMTAEIDILHDVVIKRTGYDGRIKVENVPPDEFLISGDAKTIDDARFVCHRVRKTLSDLRQMYPDQTIDPADLGSGEGDLNDWSSERMARYQFDNTNNFSGMDIGPNSDEALTEYWLYESFMYTDYDGDGITELRKVCSVGDYILANEEVDFVPFISISPITIPHKFFGLSVADLVTSLQLMKSTLMRNLMDNMYNQNFGRYAVLEGQANLDDLLTQRPGGVVRVKSPNAVTPLVTPPLEPYSFQMLEYLDSVRESRAGVSKMSQGMNENALTSHTTATAVNAVMTAAQSRVELIARNFAETGVKDLMRTIYELLLKNQDKKRVVMLRNEWIPVRPDSWNDKYDCTVSVALGNGNKDQQLAHLSAMLSFAGEAMKGGLSIVTEQNMYNIGAAMVKNMGFQNVQDFLTDPSQAQKQQGPSSEEQMAQMEMQLKQKELEIKAADVQVKQEKIKQEYQKNAVDAQLKIAELKLEQEQERAVAIGDT